MNELTVAQIDAHVGGQLAGVSAVEEHQIAGLQLSLGHGGAVAHLSGGGAVNGVTVLLAHISNKTGAVKAAGGSAAVRIAGAQILLGKRDNVTRGGAGVGQHQEIAADISLRTVFTGDIVPLHLPMSEQKRWV